MGYHDHAAMEGAERDEALLSIVAAVILEGDRKALEERPDPGEIDAMLPEVRLPFPLIPFEPHPESVATRRNYVNPPEQLSPLPDV